MRQHLAEYPELFGPEAIELLAGALEEAWQSLSASGTCFDDAPATRTALAKIIIIIAMSGERDRRSLVDDALLRFKRLRQARQGKWGAHG
jgi:hypothetical protein